MNLEGKVAIVTGAARGIGQEYCMGLSREGAKIVAADVLPLEETASLVKTAGGAISAITTDVSMRSSITRDYSAVCTTRPSRRSTRPNGIA